MLDTIKRVLKSCKITYNSKKHFCTACACEIGKSFVDKNYNVSTIIIWMF